MVFSPNATIQSSCAACRSGKTVEPAPPLEHTDWPKWAKLFANRRIESDIGVGDTVQRYAAKVGGEQFKRFSKWLGIPCGCTERQGEWNRLYPYD